MPISNEAKKALTRYNQLIKTTGKRYGSKFTKKTKSKTTKKYITRSQVKKMIDAKHDPEYIKYPIGGAFNTSTIGTNSQVKHIVTDATFRINSRWQTYAFQLPKGDNPQNSAQVYGNRRDPTILLKRIAMYMTISSNQLDTYVKYIIVETTADSEATYQAALEKQQISALPMSYVTPLQQRILQNSEEIARRYKVVFSKTILIKGNGIDAKNRNSNPSTRKIQYSKKFGKNGRKIRFNSRTATDGTEKVYYLSIAAVLTDGSIIDGPTSDESLANQGVQTVYWDNIGDPEGFEPVP